MKVSMGLTGSLLAVSVIAASPLAHAPFYRRGLDAELDKTFDNLRQQTLNFMIENQCAS